MATKCRTNQVGLDAALNVFHAVRYAGETGRPINTHVTISFVALGIGDDQAHDLFKVLQAKISRWWRYQRCQKGRSIGDVAAVYSHANPADSRHVHWLVHVPPEISDEFSKVVAVRLSKVTGQKDLRDALFIGPVDTPGTLAKYILRGVNPMYARYLHLRAANEGTVTGRRTGTSRAVGRATRKGAGWKRKGK